MSQSDSQIQQPQNVSSTHGDSQSQAARQFIGSSEGAQRDNRVDVNVPGGPVTITESAEALFRAIGPTQQMFYRGGVVVEVVLQGEGVEVQVLDPVAAQSRFEKYARFFKVAKQGSLNLPQPTTISEAVAKQYLKSEACREHLPKLNGVLHCPLLVQTDQGLHRMGAGYDRQTGFYVSGGAAPDQVSLQEAITYLKNLLRDFDFVSAGDKSRAIASLITPALKLGGFIQGPIPVDVAEANASQSGKTYRQKLIAALYNQKLAVVTKKGGGVGSMEETFNDHLVKGKVFIQFDNMRGKLDSQYLESFLTADGTITARIPYHGNVLIDPSKFIVFISSNGFEATKDLANRASIIRIRKRENHHYETFQGMDMLQFVYAFQPLLLGAVFAVIEEWVRLGKPKTAETRHDFREWCQSLDWMVQNIFHEAPLMDGHEGAKERAANPQLTFLRAVAISLAETGQFGEPISASDIAEAAIAADLEIPGLTPDKQTVEDGRKQVGKIMGKLFGDKTELTFDEYRIVKETRWEQTMGGNSHEYIRYTFDAPTGQAAIPTPM